MISKETQALRKAIQKRIGENVRFKREQSELTISQTAKELDVSESFLGLIERGDRGTCLDKLISIADYFSISLDELILHNLEAESKLSEKDKKPSTGHKTLTYLIDRLSESQCKYFIQMIKGQNKIIEEYTGTTNKY